MLYVHCTSTTVPDISSITHNWELLLLHLTNNNCRFIQKFDGCDGKGNGKKPIHHFKRVDNCSNQFTTTTTKKDPTKIYLVLSRSNEMM